MQSEGKHSARSLSTPTGAEEALLRLSRSVTRSRRRNGRRFTQKRTDQEYGREMRLPPSAFPAGDDGEHDALDHRFARTAQRPEGGLRVWSGVGRNPVDCTPLPYAANRSHGRRPLATEVGIRSQLTLRRYRASQPVDRPLATQLTASGRRVRSLALFNAGSAVGVAPRSG